MEFSSQEFVDGSINKPVSIAEAIKFVSIIQMKVRMVVGHMPDGDEELDAKFHRHMKAVKNLQATQLVATDWIDLLPNELKRELKPLSELEKYIFDVFRKLIGSEGESVSLTKKTIGDIRIKLSTMVGNKKTFGNMTAEMFPTYIIQAIIQARLNQTLSERHLLTNHMLETLTADATLTDLRFNIALVTASTTARRILWEMLCE